MPGRKTPGPSVKDPKLYEELRDEGNSKQKSARIANEAANSSRSKVGRKGGKALRMTSGKSSTSESGPPKSA